MLEPDAERRLAIDLFNDTWTLLDQPERTPADDERMIAMAHASLFHWSNVGTASNRAIGHWQIARVYAVLGHAEESLFHAERCHALTDADAPAWQRASALEGVARAHLVAGRRDEAIRWADEARSVLETEKDPADRQVVQTDLDSLGL